MTSFYLEIQAFRTQARSNGSLMDRRLFGMPKSKIEYYCTSQLIGVKLER